MSNRTDKELIEIVKVKRADYEPEALEVAERELESRNVNPDHIERVKHDLTNEDQKNQALDARIASSWIRLVHFIVDLVTFLIISLVMSLILDIFINFPSEALIELLGLVLFVFSYFSYFMFMEFKFQKTLGKFLTKTKVVMEDGSKPLLTDIFIRTLCRLIPIDQFSYIFMRSGFHDMLSGTTVIKDEKTSTANED